MGGFVAGLAVSSPGELLPAGSRREKPLPKEFHLETPPFYFKETGHRLLGKFQKFWRQDGNGMTVGLPITEVFWQAGRIVQYFERARLEWFPEHKDTAWEVQLGLLGQEVRPDLVPNRQLPPFNPYFVQKYGGWDFLGYPLTEPAREGDITYQFTQRFLLIEHDAITVPRGLDGAYRKYKEYKEARGVKGLLWPGEIEFKPLGREIAEKRGIDTRGVEQGRDAVLYTPELTSGEKIIEVEKSSFTLKAYEGDLVVFSAFVSTARPGFLTPEGEFRIPYKVLSMTYNSQGVFAPAVATYYLTDVPFNLPFEGHNLIHGTYWHSEFRRRNMSAGCVNLNLDDAWWVYRWAEEGTRVVIAA